MTFKVLVWNCYGQGVLMRQARIHHRVQNQQPVEHRNQVQVPLAEQIGGIVSCVTIEKE
jgi:hypothetical protein